MVIPKELLSNKKEKHFQLDENRFILLDQNSSLFPENKIRHINKNQYIHSSIASSQCS